MTFVSLALVNASPCTSATPYPRALRSRLIPKAVTTTSLSILLSSSSTMFNGALPAFTSCCLYPTKLMINVAPGLTFRLNLPSRSVTTPLLVPFSTTEAPITGPNSSFTIPVTLLLCCSIAKFSNEAALTCEKPPHKQRVSVPQSNVFLHFFTFIILIIKFVNQILG